MKCEWYLYGELKGTTEIEMTWSHDQRHVPYSHTRVCWNCGDAWSQVKVCHPNTKWIGTSRLCPKCGPGVMNEYEDNLYELPQELSLREFELMKECKVDYEIHLITGGCDRDLKVPRNGRHARFDDRDSKTGSGESVTITIQDDVPKRIAELYK